MYKGWSRFQPILRYRKSVEDGLSLKLADIKRRFKRKEEELLNLKNKCLLLKGELLKEGKSDWRSIAVHGQYLLLLSDEISKVEEELEEINVEMEETREKLLQASKERKVVEKIIERCLEVQKKSEKTKETKLLDETGIISYINRAGKGNEERA